MRKTKSKKTTSVGYGIGAKFVMTDVNGVQRGIVRIGILHGDDPEDPKAERMLIDMDAKTAQGFAGQLKDAAKEMERWMSTNQPRPRRREGGVRDERSE